MILDEGCGLFLEQVLGCEKEGTFIYVGFVSVSIPGRSSLPFLRLSGVCISVTPHCGILRTAEKISSRGCCCTLITCQMELEADCGCEGWEVDTISWLSYYLPFEAL